MSFEQRLERFLGRRRELAEARAARPAILALLRLADYATWDNIKFHAECQRADYDEWMQERKALLQEKCELLAKLSVYENDLKVAAGSFTVPSPEPGTAMAKLLLANRLLRAEKNKYWDEVIALRK